MINVADVVKTYATETEDGRIFLVHNFANEDFHASMRDEDGLTHLGRFNTLTDAQSFVQRIVGPVFNA